MVTTPALGIPSFLSYETIRFVVARAPVYVHVSVYALLEMNCRLLRKVIPETLNTNCIWRTAKLMRKADHIRSAWEILGRVSSIHHTIKEFLIHELIECPNIR